MELNTIEDLVSVVKGSSIEGGEIHDDGLHLILSGGKIILIIGALAVALLNDRNKLQ